MSDITEFISKYLDQSKFEVLSKELYKTTYEEFCNKFYEYDREERVKLIGVYKLLGDAIVSMQLIQQMRSNSNDKQVLEFIEVLEITLFVSLVEAYTINKKDEYIEYDDFLVKRMLAEGKDSVDKNYVTETKRLYLEKYSLSKRVREFVNMAPLLDRTYLSSALHIDRELLNTHGGLMTLGVLIKRDLYKANFTLQRMTSKYDILKIITDTAAGSGDKVPIKKINEAIKLLPDNPALRGKLYRISNRLYDIRSIFLHAGKKKDLGGLFIDYKKGWVLNLDDIDLLRYFIRTILAIYNYDLLVFNIPSRSGL